MGPQKKLTPKQEREIIERYSTGESVLSISRSFTNVVSVFTIHNTLKRHSVTTRPEFEKRQLTEDQRRLVVETCLGGSTVEAAANWRGVVDGDGGLGTLLVTDNIYPSINLCGHISMLEKFQAFLRTLNLELNTYPTSSGIWQIQTSGSTALTIIRTLYENATEALTRKNARARALLSGQIEKFPSYEEPTSYLTEDEITIDMP